VIDLHAAHGCCTFAVALGLLAGVVVGTVRVLRAPSGRGPADTVRYEES